MKSLFDKGKNMEINKIMFLLRNNKYSSSQRNVSSCIIRTNVLLRGNNYSLEVNSSLVSIKITKG